MKITIVGSGYVGISNAILLAYFNEITILDIDQDKINKINKKISPIKDDEAEKSLKNDNLNIKGTLSKEDAYLGADYVIIATPTNLDLSTNNFDVESVVQTIEDIKKINKEAMIVIKSTVPIGFTEGIRKKYNFENIIFSPEFLREGKALHDNLYPSRIIVGGNNKKAKEFAGLLSQGAKKKSIEILFCGSSEAEAIKLFSNTYLAMRVAYINEIDNFCLENKLDARSIIDGMGLDSRIGNHYNNPSLGYGGYCLPKDSKQLSNHFSENIGIMARATVESNQIRINYLSNMIIRSGAKKIGIYRMQMKSDSDNFREAAIIKIIENLVGKREVIVYEPMMNEDKFMGFEVIKNINEFKRESDLIVVNRWNEELADVKEKTICRDLYKRD